MLARLEAHIEVVTKAFVNLTPFAAKSSILVVWIIGLPAQPIASARWSSVSRKIIFGCFFEAVWRWVRFWSHPVKNIAAATEPPAARDRKSRLLKFFILLSQFFYFIDFGV
jgi:hypothetical protein